MNTSSAFIPLKNYESLAENYFVADEISVRKNNSPPYSFLTYNLSHTAWWCLKKVNPKSSHMHKYIHLVIQYKSYMHVNCSPLKDWKDYQLHLIQQEMILFTLKMRSRNLSCFTFISTVIPVLYILKKSQPVWKHYIILY